MIKYFLLFFCFLASQSFYAQSGCTDATACNYDSEALEEDNSCLYTGDRCGGVFPEGTEFYDENCNCLLYHRADPDADGIITIRDLAEGLKTLGYNSCYLFDFNSTYDSTAADLTALLSIFGQETPTLN